MFSLKKDNTPGPGHYKHEIVDIKTKSRSFKWGREDRFSDRSLKQKSPGPGLYSTGQTLGGPQYGFGTGVRPANTGKDVVATKDNFPGPGHYDQVRSLESYKPYEGKAK